jgi:hypothetical protein
MKNMTDPRLGINSEGHTCMLYDGVGFILAHMVSQKFDEPVYSGQWTDEGSANFICDYFREHMSSWLKAAIQLCEKCQVIPKRPLGKSQARVLQVSIHTHTHTHTHTHIHTHSQYQSTNIVIMTYIHSLDRSFVYRLKTVRKTCMR